MGASRAGRPALGLQTIINRLQANRKRAKTAAPVSDDQAQYAAHVLEKNRGAGRRFAEGAAIGSVANPIRRIVGEGVKEFAEHRGPLRQRFGAALGQAAQASVKPTGIRKMVQPGEVAKSVFEGGVAGTGIKAIQEGLEVGRAKRTAKGYLAQQQKLASGLRMSLSKLAAKVQPSVKLRPLKPIANNDYDFEV